MKRKRFSVEQIVAVLKQAELRMPGADLIRQVGLSERKCCLAPPYLCGPEGRD